MQPTRCNPDANRVDLHQAVEADPFSSRFAVQRHGQVRVDVTPRVHTERRADRVPEVAETNREGRARQLLVVDEWALKFGPHDAWTGLIDRALYKPKVARLGMKPNRTPRVDRVDDLPIFGGAYVTDFVDCCSVDVERLARQREIVCGPTNSHAQGSSHFGTVRFVATGPK